MKESLSLKFLYRTALGRSLLKVLVQPGVSRMAGTILSSRISRFLVPYFIRKHQIDMDGIEIPEGGFSSFNDFFTRKRKLFCPDLTDGHLFSPCDGFLTPLRISKETAFEIKHTQYYLRDLLKDGGLAKEFEGGTALIFRLTPADYHRYCYVADGKILSSRNLPGVLHCVRPIALGTVPVYIQNSRAYQVIETTQFGTMVQMEIGALLVGKIVNYGRSSRQALVRAGEEKGYFEFGGSTIILLFQKGAIRLSRDLFQGNGSRKEIRVRIGEYIASAKIF